MILTPIGEISRACESQPYLVEFEVESAGVAHAFSMAVATPQCCRTRVTVRTMYACFLNC